MSVLMSIFIEILSAVRFASERENGYKNWC
jgi:hypothetical protein